MSTNTGGQAFPRPNHEGMTLRDYFAGQALAGTIAGLHGLTESTVSLASDAYMLADAMLAAREAKQ